MKKIASLALAVTLLASVASAAPSAQTTRSRPSSFELASGRYSVVYLHDGETGSAGVVFKDLGLKLPSDRLSLSALYVNSTGVDARSYAGAYLSYRAYDAMDVRLDVGIGLKGVDITSLISSTANASSFRLDTRQVVFGVGLSFPIK